MMINNENIDMNICKPKPSCRKPKRSNSKILNSYGIAAYRFYDGKYEILLVKKRYTRAFSQFVRGFYAGNDDVISLFNQMTQDEKLAISSGDFNMIYYKLYMVGPPNIPKRFMGMYRASKAIYDKRWANNIELLKRLAHGTINREGLWELPKGRRNGHETNKSCAIREFAEETGIKSAKLQGLTSKPIVKHVHTKSDDIKFVSHYFIGNMPHNDERIDHYFVNGPPHFCECQLIRWADLNTCKYLIQNKSMINTITIIFNYIKNLNGGKQLYTLPTPAIETKPKKVRKRNWNTLR